MHFSHAHFSCSLKSLATPFVESPSPSAVSCWGRRCRRRMRLHLPRLCGRRQTTEDEDTRRPTRSVGTVVSSANIPSTHPGYGQGLPFRDTGCRGEKVETGPVVVAKLRIWNPRRGRTPQWDSIPRMGQDPHRSRYHRVSSPFKGEHVEQDLFLTIDVRGESRERKDHVWMYFMNDVQVWMFTRRRSRSVS